MAGIYIHIPFCKSRCLYCGFYSTTLLPLRQRYVDALCSELELRRDYLDEPVRTLYIGGGTPSQLEPAQLEQLFEALAPHLPPAAVVGASSADTPHLPPAAVVGASSADTPHLPEITLECNPDDVTPSFAETLRHLPVNRISMGAQTFSDERLRFLHRRHTSGQIATAVELLRQAGIGNISIDLMYAFPGETLEDWHDDISKALALDVEHLSAYALMYEEGTPLYTLLEQGEITEADEELSRRMYYDLIDRLTAAGYDHYEISNFAHPLRSQHNSSYWNGTPYLGLGAAAHSYNRHSRQWNVDDVQAYIEGVHSSKFKVHSSQELPFIAGREELDADTRYNDTVMTALRTKEGLPLDSLTDDQRTYCLRQAERYLTDGLLVSGNGHLHLSRRGLFVSDMVMTDLMMIGA
jgi:oxygen-independent coproporphyrinogen-3 oxidase